MHLPIGANERVTRASQITYRVKGVVSPLQQADFIRKALGSLPGIEAGSVAVSENEISFRLVRGFTLIPAHDAVRKLGYQVYSTSTSPAR